ncbi:hypothetical protein IHQ68_17700 [Chelatococcus sambhunathii]|uniref:Rhamnosyl transferase n=2 Tax=Chelatococcus sambhunathii TaxID=363953 RepID=A0ABU1DK08_9HYPH|nr:hypothetical protein [Chelatococcus sambhunathii]
MRFNVVTRRGTRFKAMAGRQADEAVRAILQPDRIRKRLDLFRAIPMRSFQAQTDRDFRVLVLISAALGDEFKQELHELQSACPFLMVHEVALDGDIRAAASARLSPGRPAVTFRIDDDDALNPDFVGDLRSAALRTEVGTVISFENGFHLGAGRGRLAFQEVRRVNNAQGLAYVSDDGQSIYSLGSHGKIERFPIVVEGRRRAWMRALHDHSDSGARISKKLPVTYMPPEFLPDYAPEFDFLDGAEVCELLSRPQDAPST